MNKRVISVVLLITFMLSLSVPAFASQNGTKKNVELHPPVGVPFLQTEESHTPIPEGEVYITSFGWWVSTLEAWWSVWSGAYATATSDSYTDSSEQTRWAIDYIYAKARIYVDGGLKAQLADTQTNSSHAGATANYWGTGSGNGIAYSNHEFRESGYQTLIKELGPLNCD